MILFPPCKINLGLKILRKRADGFHDLETLLYPVNICDALEVKLGNTQNNQDASILFNGFEIAGELEDNLVYKAFRLIQDDYLLPPVTFSLLKNIPMGAGLGGGSSDAAYTIRLLNQYFGLDIIFDKQLTYAAELGSDCSFFLYDQACIGTNRGETLEPIDFSLSGYWLVLILPNIHVSTAEAYKNVVPSEFAAGKNIRNILAEPMESWKDLMKNDFEESVFSKYTVLQKIKNELYSRGAIYASMSGSGSAMFGIFKNEPKIKSAFSDYRYWEILLS